MTHVDDRVIELARTALAFEFGGEHFYRHAAEMTENARGKAMFLRLADEEKGHTEETHELFGALLGEELWQRILKEEEGKAHPSKLVDTLETNIVNRGHMVVADETHALRLAMELERKAIEFYEDLAKHTEDPGLLKLIRRMADEERFHYDILQSQLDSVLNVGLWLDQPEFRMDGKF